MNLHKSLLTIFLSGLIALTICAPALLTTAAQESTPAANQELETTARSLVNLLAAGDYEAAIDYFDPTMRELLPPEKLAETWQSLQQQAGAYQGMIETISTQKSNLQIVYITSQFEKGEVDIKVVFTPDGQVAGLWFTPGGTGRAASQEYVAPAYVVPGTFSDQEVMVGAGDWQLPGTLSLPEGPGLFPAVLLVHGSGPNDRDETIGPNKPFRDLAEGLASQGIAVLRYDKRSKVYPEQMMPQAEQFTVEDEVIEDAIAAINLLKNTPGVDPERIYLLGHSLGGMLAPRIADRIPDLAGVIILAGFTRPPHESILDQLSYLVNLDGEISVDEQEQIGKIERMMANVADPSLSADASPEDLMGMPASYWLDLRSYNPTKVAAGLSIPRLILQGERDYQVTLEDFSGWQDALEKQDGVFLKLYPGLNHLFMSGTGPGNPAESMRMGHVSNLVLDDIAEFIQNSTVDIQTNWFESLSSQEITRLVLLLLPIFLIQLAISIYAIVDLAKRKTTRGPRWMWVLLLVFTLFALPSGLVVAAVYLVWGRKDEEDAYDSD